MKNPIEFFFSIGDKVTKGDIKRKADWDYYLLWVMFLAFFSIFVDNLYLFYKNMQIYNLGWALVVLAILWFQYFGLKGSYEMRKIIKGPSQTDDLESSDEMLGKFEENDN